MLCHVSCCSAPYALQNNGMKFFTAEGGLAKPDIAQILTTAAEKAAVAGVELGDEMQVWMHGIGFTSGGVTITQGRVLHD
jgi:hypothetical protein